MRSTPLLSAFSLLGLACGSDGTGPRPPDGEGARLATEFERLADSVESGGYSPAAEALRHAALIVRLTGHATPVTVWIDGRDRSFVAVAEQIDFPNLVCSWPSDSGASPPPDTVSVPPPDSGGIPPQPPDTVDTPPSPPDSMISAVVDSSGVNPPPECQAEGTYSMRTLIAWDPEHMNEVVRLVAHIGSGEVQPNVPDVMTGLPGATMNSGPSTTPPDSGSGSGGQPGGYPGFMGEYLVRDVGSWYASAGDQTNDLEGGGGPCTSDRANFDWAQFGCEAARFRFQFSMQVDPSHYERLTTDSSSGPEGSHSLGMRLASVDGVRLAWVDWTPPPEPAGPDPIPVDSARTDSIP